MTRSTKVRVTDINHTNGMLCGTGKFDGAERTVDFQFRQTYRFVEINYIRGDVANFSLSYSILAGETYPHIDDEIYLFDNEGRVLGWCYLLDYELALFKYNRRNPVRVTSWMKTLGISEADKVTEQLVNEKFRKLSKELHPDVFGGDVARFQKLADARDQALLALKH